MEEYVRELDTVLQKLQTLKIESTYGNILIMKDCIETILDLGRRMNGQEEPQAPVLQAMPQQKAPAQTQIGPEIVEVEEIGNSDV